MLIRHERFVGFRCPECSSVNIKQISVFDFSGNKKITLGCSCKASYIGITDKGNRYLVAAPCVACYERHFFTVKKTLYGVRKYFVSIVRSRCLVYFASANMTK